MWSLTARLPIEQGHCEYSDRFHCGHGAEDELRTGRKRTRIVFCPEKGVGKEQKIKYQNKRIVRSWLSRTGVCRILVRGER